MGAVVFSDKGHHGPFCVSGGMKVRKKRFPVYQESSWMIHHRIPGLSWADTIISIVNNWIPEMNYWETFPLVYCYYQK